MTVKTAAPLAPPVVVTVTLRAPVAAIAEIVRVAVICVALTTVTLLTVMSAVETVTVAPARKFVPVRVTGTVAPWAPLDGAMAVRVGAALLTVKTTAPLVPPAVVTVTLRAPVAALAEIVRVAVIWVGPTTVMLLTVTPVEETVMVAPAAKLAPVRVTGTVAPWAPLDGAMAVRAGAAGLTVKTVAAVVPPAVVTVTLRAPVAGGGDREAGGDLGGAHDGHVTDRDVGAGDIHRSAGNGFVPVEGELDARALHPVRGAMPVRVGGAGLTVKTAAAVVPPLVLTVTFRAPSTAVGAMARVAVIWVVLTTVTLLTVMSADETLTTASGAKFVPVRVTGTLGARQAGGGRDRDQARRRGNAGVDLDFTQADVGASGIVDGEADPSDGSGGEGGAQRRAVIGKLSDRHSRSVAEGQRSGEHVVGEIGAVVERDAGD